MSIDTASLAARLGAHGLSKRGGLTFKPGEPAPPLRTGGPAVSVVLIGPVGGSLWPSFSAWHAAHPGVEDPLDNWSKAVIGAIAEDIGATAWYPSDPPYQPFQRWAMAAEGLAASPLGILIHPTYGLWHSYRGALGFAEPWPEPPAPRAPHPCRTCSDKPCLTSCPVAAVQHDDFNVTACRRFLASPEGQASCMARGCTARNACPIGRDHRYPAEQIRFHMGALKA